MARIFGILDVGTPKVTIPTLFTDTQEPTGFLNRTATLSWTNTGPDRTFAITGSHTIYINGVATVKSTASIQIANTTGLHHIYYNASGTLVESTSFPGNFLPYIASVYWNATTSTGVIGDERHGITMDGTTHGYLHTTVGSRYVSGLALSSITDTTFATDLGVISDEDLSHDIGASTTCDVFYKNGSADFEWQSAQTAIYGSSLRYNNVNTLTAVGISDFAAYWIFATNAISTISKQIVVVIGQRVDTTIANARANNTYDTLSLGTLPYREMKLLYRVIYRNIGGTPTYQESEDYRSVSNLPSGSYVATAHGTLSGLADDDHLQYALLAGRLGGQVLIGGTATTDDLTLRTTSGAGASGSDMIFQVGTNGGTEAMRILYDGKVGIGTTNPGTKLQVNASSGYAGYFVGIGTTGSSYGLQVDAGMDSTDICANFRNQPGTSTFLFITGDGKVGIGLSGPGGTLHVQGAGVGTDPLSNSACSVLIEDSRSMDADVGGQLLFRGKYTTPGGRTVFAGIRGVKLNATTSNTSGRLEFYTRNNGDNDWTGDQRMVIDNVGNVGIGTTNPTEKLMVDGNIAPLTNNTRDLGTSSLGWANLYMASNIHYASDLLFKTSGNEKVRFTTTGYVGIGITNPSGALHVSDGTNTSVFFGNQISNGTSSSIRMYGKSPSATLLDVQISLTSAGYFLLHTQSVSNVLVVDTSTGYVGIGITAPVYTLDVLGNFRFRAGHLSVIDLGNWGHQFTITDGTTQRFTYNTYRTTPSGQDLAIFTIYAEDGTTPKVLFRSDSGSSFINSGTVGIGTTAPGYTLDVNGDINISAAANYRKNGSVVTISPWVGSGADIYFTGGNVGIGTASPGAKLQVNTDTGYAGYFVGGGTAGLSYGLLVDAGTNGSDYCARFQSQTGATEFLTILGSGNVGIGTASPAALLDVTIPYPKTDTTIREAVYFKTNDASTPFCLRFLIAGSAVDANRVAMLQTTTAGILNGGVLSLQNAGGNVSIGGQSVSLAYANRVLQLTDASNFGIIFERTTATTAAAMIHMNTVGELQFHTGASTPALLSGSTMRVMINTSGYVGIGTTDPTSTLHVVGSSVSILANFAQSRTTGNSYGLVSDSSGTGGSLNVGGYFSASNASSNYAINIGGSPAAGATNYAIYSISPAQSYFAGNIGIGTTAATEALMTNGNVAPDSDNNHTLGTPSLSWSDLYLSSNIHYKSDLLFKVSNAEKVRITTDGNVGIGTASPNGLLEVFGGTYSTGIRAVTSHAAGAGISLKSTDTGGREFNIISTGTGNAPGAGCLAFFDLTAGGLYRMVINSSGQVGINTTSPADKFHVAGSGIFGTPSVGAIRITDTGSATLYIDAVKDGAFGTAINLTSQDATGTPRYRVVCQSDAVVRLSLDNSETYDIYAYQNTLSAAYGVNGSADFHVNYAGYARGFTQFRNLYLDDGQGQAILQCVGSTHNVGIGTGPGTARFYVYNSTNSDYVAYIHNGATSSPYGLYIITASSSGGEILRATNGSFSVCTMFNSGRIYWGSLGSGAGNSTLKYSTSTAEMTYDTSSIRFKESVADLDFDPEDILRLQPRSFTWKNGDGRDFGLIAEEVKEINPLFSTYGKDGECVTVKYDKLVSPIIGVLKKQAAVIAEQKNTITSLLERLALVEAKLETL